MSSTLPQDNNIPIVLCNRTTHVVSERSADRTDVKHSPLTVSCITLLRVRKNSTVCLTVLWCSSFLYFCPAAMDAAKVYEIYDDGERKIETNFLQFIASVRLEPSSYIIGTVLKISEMGLMTVRWSWNVKCIINLCSANSLSFNKNLFWSITLAASFNACTLLLLVFIFQLFSLYSFIEEQFRRLRKATIFRAKNRLTINTRGEYSIRFPHHLGKETSQKQGRILSLKPWSKISPPLKIPLFSRWHISQ